MRPGAPRLSCPIWLEKSATARSCRNFQAKSTTKPTAKMAAVINHNPREDKLNLDLDNDDSQRRLILYGSPWCEE
jgi:hypothetical protein